MTTAADAGSQPERRLIALVPAPDAWLISRWERDEGTRWSRSPVLAWGVYDNGQVVAMLGADNGPELAPADDLYGDTGNLSVERGDALARCTCGADPHWGDSDQWWCRTCPGLIEARPW